MVPSASSHSLTVPYAHVAVTPFQNGIPSEQVRELHPTEKKWDFWTSSDAFMEVKPSLGVSSFFEPEKKREERRILTEF